MYQQSSIHILYDPRPAGDVDLDLLDSRLVAHLRKQELLWRGSSMVVARATDGNSAFQVNGVESIALRAAAFDFLTTYREEDYD